MANKPPAFRFDGQNPAAQRVAARRAAAMVTEVSAETRAAIRSLITRSIAEGIPPYDAARMIEGMIGLTEKQAQAAMSYRQTLINSGQAPGRVDTLVARYNEKLLQSRAKAIARTEVMDALNAGQQESWREAQAEGLLGPGATKTWITTPDERLCPKCGALEDKTVPLGDLFPGGHAQPPGHPNCRCTIAVNP